MQKKYGSWIPQIAFDWLSSNYILPTSHFPYNQKKSVIMKYQIMSVTSRETDWGAGV